MKLSAIALLAASSATAFVPGSRNKAFFNTATRKRTTVVVNGYLDDLTKELYSEADEPDVENETREATKLDKEKVDRYGVGDWDSFVEFEEFDGGDGQMGVAGDGKAGLEKEWEGGAEVIKADMNKFKKSKMMSAKNAWGTTTGYADELRAKGVETSRAQQLENWQNQNEIKRRRDAQRYMTDEFDQVNKDEDWRQLSSFGIERNQDFDLDEAFGEVTPGDEIQEVVEINSRINQIRIHEFSLKNGFMGFSDFRARFTPETSSDWTVTPVEGSLSGKEAVDFVIKFRPQNPGTSEGYLVVETEDDKWTWKLVGSTSM